MRRILAWIALIFTLVVPAPASSGDSEHYANVGDWSVYFDSSVSGCYMYAAYDGGTWLRVGLIASDDSVRTSILIGDAAWKSIEYGKTYSITLDFGNGKAWTRPATGFSFSPPKDESMLRLFIHPSSSERIFLVDLMEARGVAVFYGSVEIANLTFKGSYQAGLKLIECQTAQASKPSDPFSSSTTVDDDPFKL